MKLEIRKSFFEVLEVLRRGKWWILGVFLLVVTAMTAFTLRQPAAYSAYTLLLLDPQGGGKEAEALGYGTLGGQGFDVRSQLLILQQSLEIARRTAMRLQEMERLPNSRAPIQILNDAEGQRRTLDELTSVIQEKHVFVSPEGDWRAGALRITAVSFGAAEAALIADTYSEEYVGFAQETSRQRIAASRAFLERQLAQRRDELRDLEAQITEHVNRDGIVALDEGSRATVDQVGTLEAALDEARIELRIKEASLQALESELVKMQPTLVRQLEPSKAEEIARLQQEIERLESIVSPAYARNPELRTESGSNQELANMQARIDQMKQRVRTLSSEYANEIAAVGGSTKEQTQAQIAQLNRDIVDHRIVIDALNARVATLEERLAGHRAKLDAVPAYSVQLAQLDRARESVAELYTTLAARLQETRVAEESEVGFVTIVRHAVTPETPDRPNRPKNLVIGVILGLMLGFLTAVVRHWLDSRIFTPGDLESRGLQVVGSVLDMRRVIKKEFGKTEKVTVGDREVHATLMPLIQPFSPVAEAYRHIYVSLQFGVVGKVLQTVLVTSAQTQEGKSTTAINLAITTARANRRTLIIDADLRRAALAEYLGQPSAITLPQLLQRQQVDPEQLSTGIDNLYALTVGEPIANSAELLGSREMRELLAMLKDHFDVIILDTPPVLALTDAVLLAPLCDVTLIVAAAGQTDGESLETVADQLDQVGARIAGVVLNRFNPVNIYKQTYGYRYDRKTKAYYGVLS